MSIFESYLKLTQKCHIGIGAAMSHIGINLETDAEVSHTLIKLGIDTDMSHIWIKLGIIAENPHLRRQFEMTQKCHIA